MLLLLVSLAAAAPAATSAIPKANPHISHSHLPSGTVFIIFGAILGFVLVSTIGYRIGTSLYYNSKAKRESEKYQGYYSDSEVMSIGATPSLHTCATPGRSYRDSVLKRGSMYISPTLSLKLKGSESVLDYTLNGSTVNGSTVQGNSTVNGSTNESTVYDVNSPNFQSRPQSVFGAPTVGQLANDSSLYVGDVSVLYGSSYLESVFRPPRQDPVPQDSGTSPSLVSAVPESAPSSSSRRYSSQFLDDLYAPTGTRNSFHELLRNSDQQTSVPSSTPPSTTSPRLHSRRTSQAMEDMLAGRGSRPPSMVLDDLLNNFGDD
ncbi:hypothetical protein DICA3_E14378 [Diutina catenulata]